MRSGTDARDTDIAPATPPAADTGTPKPGRGVGPAGPAPVTGTGWPGVVHRVEDALVGALLLLMVALPVADMLLRRLTGVGVPGAIPLVQHLTLWIALLGAGIAARRGRLLTMGTVHLISSSAAKRGARIGTSAVAAGVTALLARGGIDLVRIEAAGGGTASVAGLPVWVGMLVIPAAFAIMAVRLAWHADPSTAGRAVATAGLVAGFVVGQVPGVVEGLPAWMAVLAMVITAGLGMPIFAAIGGVAALLLLGAGIPLAALPAETYTMAISPTLAAIPLFTLAGFVFAAGGAAQRLLRLFRAWVGWLPGGTAVVLTLVFALFTIFTGGSGVTILALGGLGLQALLADGYDRRFSVGLLTGAASLGLLLPFALPLILFGIVASVPIQDLFLAGILPGLILIGLTMGWAVREGVRSGVPRSRWDPVEVRAATAGAAWDLLIALALLGALFGGVATLVEAAALAAALSVVLEVGIKRGVSLRKDFPDTLTEAGTLIGGVLVILAVAMGLTAFLVDARVPTLAVEWLQTRIESPVVFLLFLNVLLLAVGCMMDIFSATVVVAPLLVPLGVAYGVDPVHLGIIFVANLELGYLTPPVGLNLFLASYRYEERYTAVARAVLPLLGIYAAGVLLITYLPWLTTGVVKLLAG